MLFVITSILLVLGIYLAFCVQANEYSIMGQIKTKLYSIVLYVYSCKQLFKNFSFTRRI